jgi:hypothetical protein
MMPEVDGRKRAAPFLLPCAILTLILATWLCLGAWISFSAPFGSGTDESIRYVAFAAAANRWATAADAAAFGVNHFYYPPLYFLLFAPFYGDEPAFTKGYPPMSGNIALRTAGSTRLVTTEELAAVPPELVRLYRAAKVLSLLFGTGVVACLVASLRLVFAGEDGPWLVLGVTGALLLLPQFLYYHTLVNNDCLVNLLCALSFLCFIAAARRTAGGEHAAAGRWGVACAAAAGLGLLTKQSAVVLLPLLPALALLRRGHGGASADRRRATGALKHLLLLMAVTVAAGGWWVLRSVWAGDPAGFVTQRLTHGWAFRTPDLPQFHPIDSLEDVARTFIALFAGSYYGIPDRIFAIYLLIGAALLAAMMAALLRRGRAPRPRTPASGLPGLALASLAVSLLLNLVLVLVYNAKVVAPHGRLLFPTLVPAGVLLACSLRSISGGRRRFLAPLVCALLLCLGWLFAWIFRYRMVPAVLQEEEDLRPLGVAVDDIDRTLGPIWEGQVQQPLLLPQGRLAGFRILILRRSSLPQFGTVLHARLRVAPADGEVPLAPSSIGENGSPDRWTDILLERPLELTAMTPAVLHLWADKPWFRFPGLDVSYAIISREHSPLLAPMVVNGTPSELGLAITAIYR